MITDGFLFASFGVIRAIRICFFDDEFCKLQKIMKITLKIARRKETGKISAESHLKVGFLGSANVSISSGNRWDGFT
jgi:hypothetical protein